MSIEDTVRKHIGRIELPTNPEISARSEEKVFPHIRSSGRTFIEIKLTPYWGTHGPRNSFLQFWYNSQSKELEYVSIELEKKFRGKGYWRNLVEAMENIAKELGCTRIVLNRVLDEGEPFWNYLNYTVRDRFGYKVLSS